MPNGLIAKNAGWAAYDQSVPLYQAEAAARKAKLDAVSKRFEGSMAVESGQAQQTAWRTMGDAAVQKATASADRKTSCRERVSSPV